MHSKTGIKSLGHIRNIKTFNQELQNLLIGTMQMASQTDLDKAIEEQADHNRLRFLNKFGYTSDREKDILTIDNATYIVFTTPYQNAAQEPIVGWFYRHRVDQKYTGVTFGTDKDLRTEIKDNTTFRMGDMFFENWKDGYNFLDDLADNTIPEKWIYNYHKSGIPHPILKAYIENIFEKLKKEPGKILMNDDERYVVFNSNLLDKYFHEIYIIAEVVKEDNDFIYKNPFRLKSLTDLIRLNFKIEGKQVKTPDQLPEKPTFFKDINEVIFQTEWTIDRSFEKFEHIIEERKDRFPVDYHMKKNDELARALDNAINYAVAIAQRNYKFIVPHYRPQDDKIQLLMPIYLSGSFSEKPDFALILDPDNEHQIYTPQTILPLDAAYQNARLIAKPDEYWLNPDTI